MRKNVLIMFCSCLCSDVFAQAGTLDSSFDFDGKVITSSNAGGARIWDLIVQSDGKIIAAGGSGPIGVSDVIVARYNNDGSIDSSYGLNGIFTNDFGGFDLILSVDMQADGKVIAVGEANNGLTRDVLVMRLNQNGTLDSTFGTNGSTIINVINVDEFAYDVELTSTEKITICFQVDYGSSGDWGLMRLNNDGSYDTSFNNTGYGIYTIGNPDHVDGIALQNDNKIVGAGNREVVRFTEDGILDTTFNSTGVIFASVGALPLALSEVLIQSDGKIIVGGSVDGNAWGFCDCPI
ncbi:MAG: hypothetical protein IPJ79_20025 [Bacteroidetes bacterium]|nr:hypothetical protein [Bacteroidota bacterium]